VLQYVFMRRRPTNLRARELSSIRTHCVSHLTRSTALLTMVEIEMQIEVGEIEGLPKPSNCRSRRKSRSFFALPTLMSANLSYVSPTHRLFVPDNTSSHLTSQLYICRAAHFHPNIQHIHPSGTSCFQKKKHHSLVTLIDFSLFLTPPHCVSLRTCCRESLQLFTSRPVAIPRGFLSTSTLRFVEPGGHLLLTSCLSFPPTVGFPGLRRAESCGSLGLVEISRREYCIGRQINCSEAIPVVLTRLLMWAVCALKGKLGILTRLLQAYHQL
jgi:hypothetical protein